MKSSRKIDKIVSTCYANHRTIWIYEGGHIAMDGVLGILGSISAQEAKAELDRQTIADPNVGIAVAPLDIPCVEADGQQYRFYAARVLPGKWVRPHIHGKGREPYLFLGEGKMSTGVVTGMTVTWTSEDVSRGSVVVVEGGQVHSFWNTGAEPADFLFSCPATHLGEDREFPDIMGLVNSLPPGYPKT